MIYTIGISILYLPMKRYKSNQNIFEVVTIFFFTFIYMHIVAQSHTITKEANLSCWPHGFRSFSKFILITSQWEQMTPRVWPVWSRGVCLAGLMYGTSKRFYILNM